MNLATDTHGGEAVPYPAAWRMRWWMAGLVIAIFAAYANSLRAPFVYDDLLAIPDNPTIRQLWPLSEVLWPKLEGGVTVSGRPMLNLSFALNHALSGKAVWSYHVFNICIHAGAALLLSGIVRRALRRQVHLGSRADGMAFAVAAVWALHPLHTQAVTYTVQRAESLMGFFYLLTLYAFVRATDLHVIRENRPAGRSGEGAVDGRGTPAAWFSLSVGACLLGMGTKEVMVTAPLMVLLYDRTFVAGTFAAAWRARRGFYIALGATWLVLAALVLSTGGNRGGTIGAGVGVPLWAYPLTQFQAVARYLMLSVWPAPLVFEYGTFWVKTAQDVWPYALVVLPLLVATGVALRFAPVLGFLGAWFFGILAPTSLAPGTIQMIVEHRMYLPLAAVVTMVVVGCHRRLGGRAGWVAGALLVAGGLALTVQRNHDYRSALALWSDTVAKRPENPRAHEGLAEALVAAGRIEQAVHQRQEAVRLLPDESRYHYNLALTLADAGRLDDAIRHYQLSLRLVPTEAKAHNNLAVVLVQAGRLADALPHYEEAVRLRPSDAQYHYNHGVGLVRAGRFAEAATAYEKALRIQPGYADAKFNLGTALMQLGRRDEALAHYAEALRLRPDEGEYRTTFGGALLLAKRPADALEQFRAVLAKQPDAVEAHFGLGNAFAALRQFEAAIASYETVLRRAPDHANAHFKLGDALLDAGQTGPALMHYETAVRLRPDDAEGRHNLGIAYARLERWGEAQREFEAALRLRPDYADAQRNLAQLRAGLGR